MSSVRLRSSGFAVTALGALAFAGFGAGGLDAGAASDAVAARGVAAAGQAGSDVERLPNGARLAVPGGFLTLQVETPSIVRVTYAPTRDFQGDTMVVVGPGNAAGALAALNPFAGAAAAAKGTATAAAPTWTLDTSAAAVTISTSMLQAISDRRTGAVRFTDRNGRAILAETADGHHLTPAVVQGEQTFHVQQTWQPNADESLYGLGQRQEGLLNLKGFDFDLWQRNMVVHIPMLVSSRGYGVLWDNTSPSKFGDPRPFEAIPADRLVDLGGRTGGLSAGVFPAVDADVTGTTSSATLDLTSLTAVTAPGGGGRGRGTPPPIRGWQGFLVAPTTGDYQFQVYSNGITRVWFDGTARVDHYKQNWATEYDQFKVHLAAGRRYPIKISNHTGTTLTLAWKTPALSSASTSLWSEVGEGIDYYFIYGPEIDDVVRGYRDLTGRASLLPNWAYGFWQSKNKYNTQEEVTSTVAEFRRRGVPLDVIVQDWQYWPADRWGDHEFEPSRYPDPVAMIDDVHRQHARFMISVWGKFYPVTENYKAMAALDALYRPPIADGVRDWLNRQYTFYDVFKAPARRLFWEQVNRALFTKGVDAWWMDATEPDIVQPSPPTLESLRHFMDRTAIGTASRVMNAYPLMNSEAVYDGQRSTAPDQRVFILTRSGFAGIQRYATVTWSGDITSTFATLRKQITAGLNFSVAGTPYWTSDTGGYTMESRLTNAREGDALEEWRELNARWFQFSTFTPILRVHGTDRPREIWNIGGETTPVYKTVTAFNRLRHELFPYIYALAGDVTADAGTIMRPLVMDFRADARARDLTDEFMFGRAFLVCPVTEYKARSRSVYLPAGTSWFDFWTGRRLAGGQHIVADAPYESMPLYLRAGSIVPVGPVQQYIGEKNFDALTVYVYAGADGRFSLYEDDGGTYGYERGAFSRIPVSWNDGARTLTLGARAGGYPGMPSARTFNVVVVSAASPVGYRGVDAPGRRVDYGGAEVRVRF